jgi:hypothetical protein
LRGRADLFAQSGAGVLGPEIARTAQKLVLSWLFRQYGTPTRNESKAAATTVGFVERGFLTCVARPRRGGRN